MPNRMLREGILTSERVNRLGPQAEILYRRLMSVVDDFGRYHGHPGLIRAGCYPLKLDQVREADITRWLAEVQSAGLILLYSTSGKQFVQLLDTRWQVRAHGSKFPEPPPESANICAQMLTDAPVVVGVDVDENVDVGVVEKTAGKPPVDSVLVEQIYLAYPLKVAKPAALRAISKALKKHDPQMVLDATRRYATCRAGPNGRPLPYTPNPATWFNEERFNDPPETWSREDGKSTGATRQHPGNQRRGAGHKQDDAGTADRYETLFGQEQGA